MTTTTHHLRLLPSQTPADRWMDAVNRVTNPIEQFATAADRRRRATPRSAIAWIAAVRREAAA
jgi:hypothetical protein